MLLEPVQFDRFRDQLHPSPRIRAIRRRVQSLEQDLLGETGGNGYLDW